MSNLPKDWVYSDLGQYVRLQGGWAFESANFKAQGIPLIRISNIKDGTIDLSDTVFVQERKECLELELCKGDILIAMSGATTGKTGVYKQFRKAYLNQRVGKFIKKSDEIALDYVFQIISSDSFKSTLLIDAIGGAQPNISAKQIEETKIAIPPLSEQKKITTILTSVDTVIEKTEEQIEKLQLLKKGMMQELLTKGIGHTEFKDSPFGRIPKDWNVFKIKEAAIRVQDGTHFSPKSKSGPFMYLTSKNVKFGYMSLKEINYISEEEHHIIYKRCDVKEDDILLTKDGANTGNCAINRISKPFSLLSSVAFIRCNKKVCDTHYLYQFLMSDKCQKQIKDLITGNAITRLTLEKINDLKVLLPPAKEQIKIAACLFSIDEKIRISKNYLKKNKNLKKGLMQDLLTGKVRVKVN